MKYGSRFSARYFEDLYEEIKDIRTSERRIYQKITDIYATEIDYSPITFESKQIYLTSGKVWQKTRDLPVMAGHTI